MSYLSRFKIQQACQQLDAGDILAYPTEAVYGLGCDPLNEDAVMKLLKLKQRSVDKGLILIASDFSQLAPYLNYDEKILKRVEDSWPEAVTWVIPTQHWVPEWLTGKHLSLAVRVTAHPLSNRLCEAFDGPIVSTSANPSHKKPARSVLQVRNYFPKEPQLKILGGNTGGNRNPSRIYDAVSGKCLRA